MRYEALFWIKQPHKWLALLLFWSLAGYAIWQGARHMEYRKQQIEKMQAHAAEKQAEVLQWYAEGKLGPADRPWVDVTKPFWAMWHAHNWLFDQPNGLMLFSIGQTEHFAYAKRVTVWSTPFDNDMVADPRNLERLREGAFDFVFVWLWLMPLLLVVLTFNVGSQEREQAMLPLLQLQLLVPFRRWIWQRFIATGMMLQLALLVFVGLVGLSAGNLASLLVLAGLFSAYLWFWVFLFALLSQWGKQALLQALLFVSSWLIATVLVPGVVDQQLQKEYPATLQLEIIRNERMDQEAFFNQPIDSVVLICKQWESALPFTRAFADSSWKAAPLSGSFYRVAAYLKTKAVHDSLMQNIDKREALLARWTWASPLLLFQRLAENECQTGFGALHQMRKELLQATDLLHRTLLLHEANGLEVNAEQYQKYMELVGN